MGVVRTGDARAEVEELPDARLGGQVGYSAAEKCPVLPGRDRDRRIQLDKLPAEFPISRIVILTTEPKTVDTGCIRYRRIDPRSRRAGSATAETLSG